MKFKANSKNLEKLLSKVFPAIPARTPMSILENFLFEIEEGSLKVTATDLEIVLTSSIDIEAEEDIRMVIPAKLLLDIVKSLGDTVISFETSDNDKLKMTTETGTYALGYASTEDYPKIPVAEKDKTLTISGKVLRRALEKTSFAISKEAMRPAMMGMLLDMSDEGMKFVTTDGHRLAKFVNKNITFDFIEQVIIPERAITVLNKVLPDEEIKMHLGESNIAFKINDLVMVSRLIAQKYPDYQTVIPIENENLLKVNKHELLAAIKRMLIFSTSSYQQVKLSISKTIIELFSENMDSGSSAKETIMCEYDGDDLNIGFNTVYLNDVLMHLDDSDIILKLSSPTRACILESSVQKEDEDLMMLLMPVRLNS